MEENTPNAGWQPRFSLDLETASGQAFEKLLTSFEEWRKQQPPPQPLTLVNGWYNIVPSLAEEWLLRNRPGSNRKVSAGAPRYYSEMMREGLWAKTGQPIIFTKEGFLADGQNRLWGCYLGLVPFTSYVLFDVEPNKHLFAFMDNSKVRTPANALQTAGLNGLSPLIARTIQVAVSFASGVYTCSKKKRSVKMAPIRYLHFLEENPTLRKATHLTAGEYKEAYELIGADETTAFVVWKINTLHGEEVCDQFMEALIAPQESDPDGVKLLATFLAKQARTADPLAKHIVLAYVIKAFNAWITNTPLKRLSVAHDDLYPDFVPAGEQKHPESQETELL